MKRMSGGCGKGRMASIHDLREEAMARAVPLVRPIMMTVAAIMGGLLPHHVDHRYESDVMKQIAGGR